MDRAAKYVLLDNVQFEKNYFQNRCKIRNGKGSFQFITIPVKNSALSSLILEKEIDTTNRLIKKSLATLRECYSKSPFFKPYFAQIEEIVLGNSMLSRMNIALIRLLSTELGIKSELVIASELNLAGAMGGTQVTAEITKYLGGDEYLSGQFGVDYLDTSYFNKLGIKVSFHEHAFTQYKQHGDSEFVPALSAVDLLFNCGPGSFECIRKDRKQ